ncbi:regulator [Streptomyces sp. CB02923]|uniref:helix-turn-helix domain-containing protein n=1 Tax=Streptomyces sp. CB02923 TaxID=1718985 RepID=UPI00093C7018|nr:helix-turn-helix transcriptional regulator [Streptomyces sp. CB02923]OKI09590.1 regulator [Streptomyces sp. CB02923]
MNSVDIGQSLRELREAGGKQAKVVARGAAMSPSKLSKLENGVLAPSIIDVERILTVLEVSGEAKVRLMEVARQVATEATAWRIYRRSGLHKHQEEIRAIEASTTLLRLFQPSCIPGLLQTPEYVRGILKDWDLTEDALEKMVGARLKRHDVLHQEGRSFRFLITESVLRWEIIGARSMAMQLDKIISMSRFPNIAIGVIPQRGGKPGLPTSAFVLFDARLATVEVPHAEITTTELPDIDLYLRKFQKFERVAVTGDDMRDLVAGIRGDFLRQQETD